MPSIGNRGELFNEQLNTAAEDTQTHRQPAEQLTEAERAELLDRLAELLRDHPRLVELLEPGADQ